jgi:hypothetical protein
MALKILYLRKEEVQLEYHSNKNQNIVTINNTTYILNTDRMKFT